MSIKSIQCKGREGKKKVLERNEQQEETVLLSKPLYVSENVSPHYSFGLFSPKEGKYGH